MSRTSRTPEERQRSGLEQEVEAEGVAIEGDGPFDVVDADGDLADRGELDGHGSSLGPVKHPIESESRANARWLGASLHPPTSRMLSLPRKGGGPA